MPIESCLRNPSSNPVPEYLAYDSVAEVASQVGLNSEQAELLSQSVFGRSSDFQLRLHQQDSLLTSLSGGLQRNVIVTAGTGSGKDRSVLTTSIRAADKGSFELADT